MFVSLTYTFFCTQTFQDVFLFKLYINPLFRENLRIAGKHLRFTNLRIWNMYNKIYIHSWQSEKIRRLFAISDEKKLLESSAARLFRIKRVTHGKLAFPKRIPFFHAFSFFSLFIRLMLFFSLDTGFFSAFEKAVCQKLFYSSVVVIVILLNILIGVVFVWLWMPFCGFEFECSFFISWNFTFDTCYLLNYFYFTIVIWKIKLKHIRRWK